MHRDNSIVRFYNMIGIPIHNILLQFFLAQMFSLSVFRSAIYSSTYSNHNIYIYRYILISVYSKVMYQGSVLSPLLFGVVMDGVPSEASIHPSELLHADDLVLMVMVGSSRMGIIL